MPLMVAGLAFVAFTILWIVSDRRASERVYDKYSTSNTGDDGLSLAYAYLGKQGKVAQMTKPFGREPLERNATLFRLTDTLGTFFDPEDLEEGQYGPPKLRLNPLLSEEEEAFVRAGGRVVVAVTQGVLPSAPSTVRRAIKVFPIWPAVNAFALESQSGGYTSLPPRMHAIFTAGDQVIVARERIGDGEVFALSAPEVLQNDRIASTLGLLEGLAGEKRPVYFDEVLHGIVSGDGALALMKEWNLGPFLLLLGFAALLVFWREGKRIGPPDEDKPEPRSDAVDLVRSLGALYHDVTNETQALALYRDALTRTVAHTTGLRGEALHKRVEALTHGRNDLDSINEAFRVLKT